MGPNASLRGSREMDISLILRNGRAQGEKGTDPTLVERVERIQRSMSLGRLKVLLDIEAGDEESSSVVETGLYRVEHRSLRNRSLRHRVAYSERGPLVASKGGYSELLCIEIEAGLRDLVYLVSRNKNICAAGERGGYPGSRRSNLGARTCRDAKKAICADFKNV